MRTPNLLPPSRTRVVTGWGLLVLSAGIFLGLAWHGLSLEARTGTLARQPMPRGAPAPVAVQAFGPPDPAEVEQVEAARSILARLAVPWRDLILGLKDSQPMELALTAIRPSADLTHLEIVARTSTYLAGQTFVNRLAANGQFSEVRLRRERRLTSAEAGSAPWEITVEARWGSTR
ncbi:MAG: hypothetical protein M9951_10300 [Burkholderiaceae bacterium]|nr:hypothetical protein [Burkholderiaceae bacterium]